MCPAWAYNSSSHQGYPYARFLLQGDELKLRHKNAGNRGPWEALGHVLTYQQSEEVCLELFTNVRPGAREGAGSVGSEESPKGLRAYARWMGPAGPPLHLRLAT